MSVPGAILGPCEAWIDGQDVAACCSSSVGSDTSLFDTVAVEASMLVYELSGHQFSGACSRTVRPCRAACTCFGGPSLGVDTWSWTASASSGSWSFGWWQNECGDRCGCGGASYVKLAGYPVREITEVKIDGAVLDPSGYELIGRRRLLRKAEAGPPVVHHRWPTCQDLALDDTEPGTFSITYTCGADPPQLGRDAAAALACQLYQACSTTDGECKLPAKVTKIVRQGVTMERIVGLASLLRSGATGVPALDAFIAAYNPDGLRRRPAVWSPDVPAYPQGR